VGDKSNDLVATSKDCNDNDVDYGDGIDDNCRDDDDVNVEF